MRLDVEVRGLTQDDVDRVGGCADCLERSIVITFKRQVQVKAINLKNGNPALQLAHKVIKCTWWCPHCQKEYTFAYPDQSLLDTWEIIKP